MNPEIETYSNTKSIKFLPPLALYIHFPWCIRKCPYCDFNSHTLDRDLPEITYIHQLLADLEQDLPLINNRSLVSIFLGGGTPSLFSPAAIEKLLSCISKKISFAENIEITLEANPSTVEYQRFVGYRAAGINRLSIGVQSFQPDKLKKLGRVHNDQEAVRAIEAASAANFTNFNIDLMHGLPEQTIQDALFDLAMAISLRPTHLSWYQLTIEPNTFFAHKPPQLPQEEILWDIQEAGQKLLADEYFQQYEISAYCQNKKLCVHNKNYWEFGDYLGIGAGAYSKITNLEKQTITRFWKVKNPQQYAERSLTKNFIGEKNIIPKEELPFEFMLNALRLHATLPFTLFEQRTGLDLYLIQRKLDQAQNKGLINCNANSLTLTELGKRFYNDLVAIFI